MSNPAFTVENHVIDFLEKIVKGIRLCFVLCIMLTGFGFSAANAQEELTYVGSGQCESCHTSQSEDWKKSDHFRAMEIASPESVLASFVGENVSFHSVNYRFYVEQEKFLVDMRETDGKTETHQIDYTFGFFPLQQYLVELDNGFVQALNVAWDSREESEGGQRWYHLQPEEEITQEHPFYWKKHIQNWNARCADCHSTNLSKNYDVESHSYQTTWSEINVGCEACHGPGSKHINNVKSDSYSAEDSGFNTQTPAYVKWSFNKDDDIANPQGAKSDHQVNMCGTCHSLRTQLSADAPGEVVDDNYHNSNRIQLLSDRSYHSDGQIREEVYVLGSFMQSKMYEQGVTCTNCHNPHSGKLVAEGNSLCAQCHKPVVYDNEQHHHHPVQSDGAQCVSCHMPETTYMQVDKRRDHSFTIPRPQLSSDLDVPNACVTCHIGRNNNWASGVMREWKADPNSAQNALPDSEHWAYLSNRAQNNDILVTRPLTNLLKENTLPAMVQASLMGQLVSMPSRVSVETAQLQLGNTNPMVRRAAVSALQNLPMELRWEVLSPYFKDPSRSVRFEIASNMIAGYAELYPEQKEQLDPLMDEYQQALMVSADSPATQMAIASLELGRRNLVAAEKAYLQAVKIEPGFVPALINLADYYRSIGRESVVEPILKSALSVAPDSGAANHTYGLYLVRLGDYDAALTYLGNAVKTEDAQPRFAYVYAIALESTGSLQGAIDILEESNVRWPNQYELLLTMVLFLEKAGESSSVYPYLSKLSEIAPSSPEVKQLIEKYRN